MEGSDTQNGMEGAPPDRFIKDAIQFVVNAHAATVNMRLYPASSSMVTESLEKANSCLEEVLKDRDSFTVSGTDNSLLINDERLEDTEQQKASIRSFVAWLGERGLSSIEFKAGVTGDELRKMFEFLGELSDSKELLSMMTEELADRGVANIAVNQRLYVAVDASEAEAGELSFGVGDRKHTPLDALKDELLIRYLMGKVDLGEVEAEEVAEVLSDPGKVGGLMSRFLEEEGAEGGVLIRSQKAEEALNRLAEMVGDVKDEGLRKSLTDQVTGIISEMEPQQMTSVLTGHAPANLDIVHVRENVIAMLSDKQLMDIVDSLIDEYGDMKNQVGELDTSWARDKLKNLNEVLLQVRRGDRGEVLADTVDRKLEDAGVQEERDALTGKRVLSSYQMLGAPLDEEAVDLGEGVDQTVSSQIRQLYTMRENDLAAGIMLKLTGSLENESPTVRRYAAYLVKETIETLEQEYGLVASEMLKPRLIDSMKGEQFYQAFAWEIDALALIAQLYLDVGRVDEALEILELISEQATPESGRGTELVRHASLTLEKLRGPEGLLGSRELLLDPDDEKRVRIVRALARLGPDAISPLVDMVKDRGHIEMRDRVLDALRAAGPVGVEALTRELEKGSPWYVYRNVLNVLADLECVDAVEKISVMANHPDERVRREAVRSLARIGSPESMQVVLNASNDTSLAVRRTAVRVLGMFRNPSVVPLLLDTISDRGPRGRDEDQGVVESALLALGDLHDGAHVPRIAALVGRGGLLKKGKPEEIRAVACIALGNLGDPSAVPVLEKVTKDPSAMVKSSAEKALRKLRCLVP